MKKERRLGKKENFTKLTQKKGISLIVLIVTIIVIIILAAAVILTITKNNPVESANEATFKEDVRSFQDELAMTVAKEYTDKQGQRDEKISTSDYGKIKECIPSFSEKYKGKFVIKDDKLVGTDKLTKNEKTWSESLNISTSDVGNYTPEDCFLWEGNTIIGLDEEKLSGVTKIKIPPRCTAIRSDYAFLGPESYRSFIEGIEYVEIPDTVTSLEKYAFHDFIKLKSIEIPNSVTSIGVKAFRDCKRLTSITIPNSVTSIGDLAFWLCSSLTSITIPDSVTSIGESAFYCCSSLTSINVSENNKNYSSVDGVLFNKDKTEIIQYPEGKINTSYEIPNSVTSIGDDAFHSYRSLTSITIPKGVTSIGDSAFYSCSSLTSITIPNSVTSIGDSALNSCFSLTNITYNGTKEQWNKIGKGLNWKSNSAIKTITCTDGVITL